MPPKRSPLAASNPQETKINSGPNSQIMGYNKVSNT